MKSEKNNKIILKKENLIEVKLKDKLFILNNASTNKIYQFNSTGLLIWGLIKNQTSFDALNKKADKLKKRGISEKELFRFVLELNKLRLIEVVDHV